MTFQEKLAQPWTPEFTKRMENLRKILLLWPEVSWLESYFGNKSVISCEEWEELNSDYRVVFRYSSDYVEKNGERLEILEPVKPFKQQTRPDSLEYWDQDLNTPWHKVFYVPKHIFEGLVPELDLVFGEPCNPESILFNQLYMRSDRYSGTAILIRAYFRDEINKVVPGFLPEVLNFQDIHPL